MDTPLLGLQALMATVDRDDLVDYLRLATNI